MLFGLHQSSYVIRIPNTVIKVECFIYQSQGLYIFYCVGILIDVNRYIYIYTYMTERVVIPVDVCFESREVHGLL